MSKLLSTIYAPIIESQCLNSGIFVSGRFLQNKFKGYKEKIDMLIDMKLLKMLGQEAKREKEAASMDASTR